jgi:hypothetical protein
MAAIQLAILLLGSAFAAQSDRDRYFYSDIFTPFFVCAPARDGQRLCRPGRPGAPAGQEFLEPKPRDTVRVFVVGGSIANIFLSTRREPEVRLDRVLAQALPGRRFEAIDCGMSGYDSYRESLVLEEVLEHRPDAVILMSGNNEAYGEATVDRFFRGIFLGLSRFALFRAARNAFLKRTVSRQGQMPDSSPASRRRWLEAFEENLRNMVRMAKGSRVPIVLCTLPVNFQDIPPEDDMPPAGSGFAAAREALARRDFKDAAARFELITKAEPLRPLGHYYLAKALAGEGRLKEARAAYMAALERDRLSRCSPSANAVIRRIAQAEGAALADIETEFLSAAPAGLLGRAQFLDDVHWHLEYNRLADRAVLSALKVLAHGGWHGLGLAGSWDMGALAKAERFCAADRIRIDPDNQRRINEQRLLYAISLALDAHAAKRWRPERLSERALAFFDMVLGEEKSLVVDLGGRKGWVKDRLASNFFGTERVADFEAAWPTVLDHADEACRRAGLPRDGLNRGSWGKLEF